jgi:hypothetical protein
MTSSPHDPYRSGYTCATMEMTMSRYDVSQSKSPNIFLVRIDLCNLRS